MQINSLTIEGFGSYKQKTVFDFKPELYMVVGENGTGKSTLFIESFLWLLFGKTYKNVKEAEIANDESSKCVVSIDTDKGIFARTKEGGAAVITHNQNPITQDQLNSIVQLDKELFLNSIIFGCGMTGFMLLDDSDKKQLITKINLQYVDDYIERLNEKKKELTRDSIATTSLIPVLKEQIASALKTKEFIANTAEQNKYRIVEIQKEITIVEKEIAELEAVTFEDVGKLKEEHNTLSNQKLAIEKEGVETQKTLKHSITYIKQILDSHNAEVNKSKGVLASILRGMDVIDTQECPVCFAPMQDEAKQRVAGHFMPQIQEHENIIAERNKEIELCTSELNKTTQVLDAFLQQQSEQVSAKREEITKITMLINEVNSQLALHTKTLQYKKAVLHTNTKELENLQQTQHAKQALEQADAQLIQATNKLAEREEIKANMDVENEAIEFWILKLKEFRSNLFGNVVDAFAPVCNNYLAHLTNGKIQVKLETGLSGKKRITDKFAIHLFFNDKEVDFKRLSAGEKKILALSMNMAFSMLMNKFYASDWNILVYDEIFDNLDNIIRERVVDMLIDLKNRTNKAIVVITHNEIVNQQIKTITIQKDSNGSKWLQ